MYVPAGVHTVAILGRNCEPNYKSQLLATAGMVVSIVLRPTSDLLAGSIQVDVPAGTSMRFKSSDLDVVGVGSAKLGPGRYHPTERIDGFALAEFPFALPLPASPPQIAVVLPAIELGNREVQPNPVVFELHRKAMVVGLCQ